MKQHYTVIVGNIGTVYDGVDGLQALERYQTYVQRSKTDNGRASGESVTLIHNGDIELEYIGTIDGAE